jgi:hypothetical protein
MAPGEIANHIITLQSALGIASWAVALVFGYAAVSKLVNLPALVAGIRSYRVVPGPIASLGAALLIIGEGAIAVAHFAGLAMQYVVPATIALLTVFLVTTSRLLKSGEKRPCLCFGANRDDSVDIYSLIRIAMLWLLEAALFFYLVIKDISIAIDFDNAYSSIVAITTAAAGVVLAGWLLALPNVYRALRVVET